MKVCILSGNAKGTVVDMPQIEAENAIATGYAELHEPKKDQATLDLKKAGEPSVTQTQKGRAKASVSVAGDVTPKRKAAKATKRKK